MKTSTASLTTTTITTIPNLNQWKALSILLLAQFLIILDISIIGVVAFPTIQQHFNITQTKLQWIFNAYVIAFSTMLLLGEDYQMLFLVKKNFYFSFSCLYSIIYFSRNSFIK